MASSAMTVPLFKVRGTTAMAVELAVDLAMCLEAVALQQSMRKQSSWVRGTGLSSALPLCCGKRWQLYPSRPKLARLVAWVSTSVQEVAEPPVFMAPPEELDSSVLSVLHSGYVTQGKQVEAFEAALRDFFCNERVVTLNSATSGLHLALHLLKRANHHMHWPGLIDSVDEVLTCPLTCTATNWPILANGLRIK
eukprot:6204767-Pleurochrysis_carterae.AAC.3